MPKVSLIANTTNIRPKKLGQCGSHTHTLSGMARATIHAHETLFLIVLWADPVDGTV